MAEVFAKVGAAGAIQEPSGRKHLMAAFTLAHLSDPHLSPLPVAMIGLSSAVPTPPLMATGRLGRVQLDALERILAQLSAEQLFRVLLIHHPLRSVSRIKRLTDSRKLHALLGKHGVELVLHGH